MLMSPTTADSFGFILHIKVLDGRSDLSKSAHKAKFRHVRVPYRTYLDHYLIITSLLPKGARVIGCAHLLIGWLTCSNCWWHAAPRSCDRPPSPFYVTNRWNDARPVQHPWKVILKNGLTSIFGSILDSCVSGQRCLPQV